MKTMFYYEVLVGSAKYHGQEALTYYSNEHLESGHVVRIPLRRGMVLGIIDKRVAKPSFATKVIDHYFGLPPLPPESLQLLTWMKGYYPGPLGNVIQQFLPKALLDKPVSSLNTHRGTAEKTIQPVLTIEQKMVLKDIVQPGTYLLHGETGSGKTRVYSELAQRALKNHTSAVILTPEISLTSQLAANFEAIFPGKVVVVHSHLTDSQRRNIWLGLLQSPEPLVVIGARSALFSPLGNIGVIVVDEAHEAAYKQSQSPYYHTIRVASKLTALHRGILVLGSATPAVETYYTARQKKVPILRMRNLAVATNTDGPAISIVDLRDRREFSHKPHLSNTLLAAIEIALSKDEQSLLFLNRRGTARIVLCNACGWQALCPNCDIPLTYHSDDHSLRCHVCGYHHEAPTSCPVCQNTDIVFKGAGTKAIMDELLSVFPHARLQRFDTDNTNAERFEQHYQTVKEGKIDIIVGTQTLAKGLDLPQLSVVGVICADTSLYLPDYTAQERTYQLLNQVIGRVGRGHRAGHAIVQTYLPDNPVHKAALAKDWESFYTKELAERETFMFPPFCHLLKLSCRRASQAAAQRTAEDLAAQLRTYNFNIQIIGPTTSFHEKVSGKYQWQLVIKAKQRAQLLKVIAILPANWSYDIDPTDLL